MLSKKRGAESKSWYRGPETLNQPKEFRTHYVATKEESNSMHDSGRSDQHWKLKSPPSD